MSAFMSDKYRRLAGLGGSSGARIEDSRACEGCGYELRGLRLGAKCPECGMGIAASGAAADRDDPLLALDVSTRRRVRIGTQLMGAALLVVAVAPLALLVSSIASAITGGGGVGVVMARHSIALVCGGLWLTGGLMALPSPLWRGGGVIPSSARTAVFAATAAWMAAQGIAVAIQFGTSTAAGGTPGWAETAGRLAILMRLAGGLGGVALLLVLARVAEDAEVEGAPERLTAAAWVLPILGFIIWVIPSSMPWIALIPYFLLVLLPWAVLAWRGGLGMLAIARHVGWANRIGRAAAGRDDRIADRRAELDAEWQRTVRPLPDGSAPVATRRRAGVVCGACGYDLRSTPVAARCPECGAEATA